MVVAVSGRALAAAARRAGYVPLVADFFADDDTREIAHACRKLDGLKPGFQWKTLEPALEALAEEAPLPPLGVICGASKHAYHCRLPGVVARVPL